jgi:hypothetical protein
MDTDVVKLYPCDHFDCFSACITWNFDWFYELFWISIAKFGVDRLSNYHRTTVEHEPAS